MIKRWILRARLAAIELSLLLAGMGCEGIGGKASCIRHVDGSIECSIEAHKAGNHEPR